MARQKQDERVKLTLGGGTVEVKADSVDRFKAQGATDYVEPQAEASTGGQGDQTGTRTGQESGAQGGPVHDKAVTRQSGKVTPSGDKPAEEKVTADKAAADKAAAEKGTGAK